MPRAVPKGKLEGKLNRVTNAATMATIRPHGVRSHRPHPAARARPVRTIRTAQAKGNTAGPNQNGIIGPCPHGPYIQGPKRPEKIALAKNRPASPDTRENAA